MLSSFLLHKTRDAAIKTPSRRFCGVRAGAPRQYSTKPPLMSDFQCGLQPLPAALDTVVRVLQCIGKILCRRNDVMVQDRAPVQRRAAKFLVGTHGQVEEPVSATERKLEIKLSSAETAVTE